jgi:hypothetical protein
MTKLDCARARAWLWWPASRWPLLRIPLRLAVALAMITQREGLALLLGGAALLIETVQDGLAAGRCRCPRRPRKILAREVTSRRFPPL